MRKITKFLTCIISFILLSSTILVGCGEKQLELPDNRPDYSQNTEVFDIWAYGATINDWYQVNEVRYYFEQGMIQSLETTKLHKDANFNMLFINYTFQYNASVAENAFEGSDMKKVMDWAYELGMPCIVFHNSLHGLGSGTTALIDKDKAIVEINKLYPNRVNYFDAYDYCKSNHNNCTSCTEENRPDEVKECIGEEQTLEELYEKFASRSHYYSEKDLDTYVEISLRGLKDHPAFAGVTLHDEPTWDRLAQVGTAYRSIARVCNNDENPLNDNPHVMMNMLPFNSHESHKPYFADGGNKMTSEEAYKKYLELYYEEIGQYCGYFQYDDYPIMSDGSVLETYLFAHRMTSEFCKEKGLERRMVMQTCSYSSRRAPSETDMYFQANVSQAFGNKEFSYYQYYPSANSGSGLPDETSYIVDRDGDPNPRYYWVKDINGEMLFNSKALMQFEYQGMTYKTKAPMPGGMAYASGLTNDDMAELKDYDFKVNLQAGGMVLITELYDAKNDQYGYYVVNTGNTMYSSELEVTLDFGDNQFVQIYQNSNIIDAKTDQGKAKIYLGSGRGAFVMPY